MIVIDFKEVNVRLAESQEEYDTTPAYYNNENGTITFGFKLSAEELIKIHEKGEIWVTQLTNGKLMQPMMLIPEKEEALVLTQEDLEKAVRDFFPKDQGL